MCARLGWDMNLHQLRHYSATELIAAGVDVRAVAGRLGNGGGGSTTLRAYTACVHVTRSVSPGPISTGDGSFIIRWLSKSNCGTLAVSTRTGLGVLL
jgi:hypothetical protein